MRETETKRWEDVGKNTKFHSVLQDSRERRAEKTGGEAPCESEKRGLRVRKKEGGSDLQRISFNETFW